MYEPTYLKWCREISDEINSVCPNSILSTGWGTHHCSIAIVSPTDIYGDVVTIENTNWKIRFYYIKRRDKQGLYPEGSYPFGITSPLEVEWLPPPIKEWFVFNMDKFIGSHDAYREI